MQNIKINSFLKYIFFPIFLSLILNSASCRPGENNTKLSEDITGSSNEEKEEIGFDENQKIVCASKTVHNTIKSPNFKVVETTSADFKIGKEIDLKVDEELKMKFKATFASFQKEVSLAGNKNSPALTLEIEICDLNSLEKIKPGLPADFKTNKDAYYLQIKEERTNIYATDAAGIINGINSLECLISKSGTLSGQEIVDWPDIQIRGVQLGLRGVTANVAKGAIDRIRRAHYNILVLELGNNVRFPAIGKLANNCAWAVDEFADVVQYAKESGIEVVPALRLLTHQHKEFLVTGAYPELMYDEKTYDPRKEGVYEIVFPYIDEIVNLIQPNAIHIGHDEAYGYGINGSDKGEEGALPPKLFKYNVIKVHDYLKSKNVKTWMWSDMLITPSEFPDMHSGSINGSKEYAALRKDLPKDIVMCDWHYRDESADANKVLEFPSMKMFAEEGFEVIGATFRHHHVTKAFSKYVAGLNHSNAKGMIATTWFFFRKGALDNKQSDDWQSFDEVLEVSAEAFWNAK